VIKSERSGERCGRPLRVPRDARKSLVGHAARIAWLACLVGGATGVLTAVARAEGCPNEVSRQGPSATLPDCRAYEQVTPAAKAGAEDMFGNTGGVGGATSDVGYPSQDGNRFLIDTTASFGTGGASGENSYVFSRGAGGWTFTSLAATGLGVQSLAPEVFNPSDFSEVGVTDRVGSLADPASVRKTSLIGPPGGPYTTVYSALTSEQAEMVGGAADLSRVVLESEDHQLAPGAAGQDPGSHVLYEWAGGAFGVVNVNTDGSLVSPCGAILGQNQGFAGGYHDAVANDGSKIIFTAPDPRATGAGCWDGALSNPPQLYMRTDGVTTVNLSAPEPGVHDPNGLQAAVYVGASADGSKVFFMTQTQLTADDTTHDPELYEYNTHASTKPLTRISRGVSGSADGHVVFVPAISSDGSTVYFAAQGQLAAGAPSVSGKQLNLYRYDTNAETTTYIATVSRDDYPSTAAVKWYPAAYQDEVGLAVNADWYTNANGRFLVFATAEPVTGFSTTPASGAHCEDFNTGGGNGNCYQVYRYDSTANSITCVSCDPNGAAPVSNARIARSALRADNPAGTPPRAISEDGRYVFFDSADALVPQARSGVLHVYEWHEGAVSLISAAGGPSDSFFLGSSADGSNVFLGTHAQLVPQDTDTSGDLYDARINGGFGQLTESGCMGSGCLAALPAPPGFATPATATFMGVGNIVPPPSAVTKPSFLSRAQLLKKALKACRAQRRRRRRAACEGRARKKYGRTARATTNWKVG
jgi:hypothetical protein